MEYSYTQRILHMNMMIYHYIMSHHFHVFVFLEGNSHDSIILPKWVIYEQLYGWTSYKPFGYNFIYIPTDKINTCAQNVMSID
jgi:hypothetical protein